MKKPTWFIYSNNPFYKGVMIRSTPRSFCIINVFRANSYFSTYFQKYDINFTELL